mgnify:CR=1 FL=1
MQHTAWKDFNTGVWDKAVDVRDFIQRNYIPYEGDDSFLAGPTERTTKLWEQVMKLYEEEREKNDYQFRLIQILPWPHTLLPMRQDISTKTLKQSLVCKLTNH